jgi:hypothetical protein
MQLLGTLAMVLISVVPEKKTVTKLFLSVASSYELGLSYEPEFVLKSDLLIKRTIFQWSSFRVPPSLGCFCSTFPVAPELLNDSSVGVFL